jgi:hypothetical protein
LPLELIHEITLDPCHFSQKRNQLLFKAFRELQKENKPIDSIKTDQWDIKLAFVFLFNKNSLVPNELSFFLKTLTYLKRSYLFQLEQDPKWNIRKFSAAKTK